MSKPIRIQRKRTKGWKMPENTVYVGRPTVFGNVFKAVGDIVYGDASWRRTVMDRWVVVEEFPNDPKKAKEKVVEFHKRWLNGEFNDLNSPMEVAYIKEALKGKNLACFCPPDQPCHADVLLEIANS